METIEALKELAPLFTALAAVALPLYKYFNDDARARPQVLRDRYAGIKAFFEDDALREGIHPLQTEAAFAAAVGYQVTRKEIPLLLRQDNPGQFIDAYARVKDYVGPNKEGDKFELRSLAKHALVRTTLVVAGAGCYLVLVFGTVVWLIDALLGFVSPSSWTTFGVRLLIAPLPLAVGFYFLIGASRLNWAAILVRKQLPPAPSPPEDGRQDR